MLPTVIRGASFVITAQNWGASLLLNNDLRATRGREGGKEREGGREGGGGRERGREGGREGGKEREGGREGKCGQHMHNSMC